MTAQEPSARDLVLAATGHILVTGGPGSGKTTLALDKALQRMRVGLQPGQSVLFLSFSRAAVARLAEAAVQQVPSSQREQLSLQTFHSFFWEILRTHGYLLGTPKRLKVMLPHDERALSGGVKPKDEIAWAEWEQRREQIFLETGQISFDLFAGKACELVRRSAHIKNLVADQFPLIIVDEAQDTGDSAWTFITLLKDVCQIVCLADLEQQIFDHLAGVGPERVTAIKAGLRPLEVNLGQVNNRSPGTEIAMFARDILDNRSRGSPYVGVTRVAYNQQTVDMGATLRKALAIVVQHIRKRGGGRPDSIALLATTGRDVALISAALTSGSKPVAHKVVFDEALAILASRFAAFLLEPKSSAAKSDLVAEGLDLVSDIERSRGTAGGGSASARCRKWADAVQQGQCVRGKLAATIARLVDDLCVRTFTGDPGKDWLAVKALIRGCGDPSLVPIAGILDYLVAFNRGRRITTNLAGLWAERGTYAGARLALDAALAQDALLGGLESLSGTHVMTIHRSKGKQFERRCTASTRYANGGQSVAIIFRMEG